MRKTYSFWKVLKAYFYQSFSLVSDIFKRNCLKLDKYSFVPRKIHIQFFCEHDNQKLQSIFLCSQVFILIFIFSEDINI